MVAPLQISSWRFWTLIHQTWIRPECRNIRVIALLLGIVLISLGDLQMTLEHLRGPGLLEANPLARSIMKLNSPLVLAAFKLGTVGLAVGILFRYRKNAIAEAACFAAFLLLVGLCVQWIVYSDALLRLSTELSWSGGFGSDPRAVAMTTQVAHAVP